MIDTPGGCSKVAPSPERAVSEDVPHQDSKDETDSMLDLEESKKGRKGWRKGGREEGREGRKEGRKDARKTWKDMDK